MGDVLTHTHMDTLALGLVGLGGVGCEWGWVRSDASLSSMATIPHLPYGDPEFRLRGAHHARRILEVIMSLDVPNGDLGNTLTLGSKITVVSRMEPGANDLEWLVYFLDHVGGEEGVDEVVRALGPDADADTRGVLVKYFRGLHAVSEDLENDVYPDLSVALTELETLQEDLDDALGLEDSYWPK